MIKRFEISIKVPDWYIFGEDKEGNVDISDINGDIFIHVPKPLALEICKARNEFIEKITELVNGEQKRIDGEVRWKTENIPN